MERCSNLPKTSPVWFSQKSHVWALVFLHWPSLLLNATTTTFQKMPIWTLLQRFKKRLACNFFAFPQTTAQTMFFCFDSGYSTCKTSRWTDLPETIWSSELPGSSSSIRGEAARLLPVFPGLGATCPGCWWSARYLGGRRWAWLRRMEFSTGKETKKWRKSNGFKSFFHWCWGNHSEVTSHGSKRGRLRKTLWYSDALKQPRPLQIKDLLKNLKI